MTFFVRRLCKKELNLNFFLMRAMGFSVNNNQEVHLRNIFFIFFFQRGGHTMQRRWRSQHTTQKHCASTGI